MKIKTSQEALNIINEKTKLNITLPENQTFAKIKTKGGKKFFSVMLETQTSESAIFQQLQNFARHCSFIESVQAGGANMATIILKTNTTNN